MSTRNYTLCPEDGCDKYFESKQDLINHLLDTIEQLNTRVSKYISNELDRDGY